MVPTLSIAGVIRFMVPIELYSSVALQTEAYEECLRTYSLKTCFNANGTTVECDSEDSIDSFQMPDW